MGCRLCKAAIGLIILIALTAAIASLISSGGGAFPAWTAFITWLGEQVGIVGGAALKAFGYRVFTALLALGAALVYILADYIDWILCEICKLLGRCEECPEPHLNPK